MINYYFRLKYFCILLTISFSILCINCYYVDTINFEHENYSPSGNPFDDHRNYDIIPSYHDGKGFLTAIRTNNSSYAYKSSLFWIKDKVFVLKIDVSVYSEEGIDNIQIKNCEIVFNNFSVIFDKTELANTITKKSTNAIKPFIRNYIIIEKEINVKTIDKYLNKIKNNSIENILILNINIDYEEYGEIKNWKKTTEYFINIGRTIYSPVNLWGGLP